MKWPKFILEKSEVLEVTDNTIMPDGRPFFAWGNELSMLRKQRPEISARNRELNHLMQLLQIAHIEQQKDWATGDLIIRLRMVDAIKANDPKGVYKQYQKVK